MLNSYAPEFTFSLFGLVFSEGLLAFISPCILPMLPVYIIYLCGKGENPNKKKLIINSLGFIAGFSLLFILLGATASGIGRLLSQHKDVLARISGFIMIIFGINFLGVVKIPFLNKIRQPMVNHKNLSFFSSMIFGGAFSLGWTPCLGAFLGSALMLASNYGTIWQGIALLAAFALGLGIPFFLTAVLWDKLQGVLRFIKQHFRKIQIFSGILLIVVGMLMIFDWLNIYMRLFA